MVRRIDEIADSVKSTKCPILSERNNTNREKSNVNSSRGLNEYSADEQQPYDINEQVTRVRYGNVVGRIYRLRGSLGFRIFGS